jgi:nicotinamide phosphoribosyltransferase
MRIIATLLKDGYKAGHIFQYPEDTEYIYSNFTPRKSRTNMDSIVFFGLQYFLKEYLLNKFSNDFFHLPEHQVMASYDRRMNNYLGKGAIPSDHIRALWKLGYLPLHIKALPEGTLVPMGVPALTVINTKPEFFWLTNMLETILSNILWLGCTSATTALMYRRTFEVFADKTGGSKEFIDWQGHDFSFRGMPGLEAALISGAAHLTSFTGTDTIPAIDFLEYYYRANSDNELIGGSVAATEHTWDLWKVVTDFLPRLKNEIMTRNGKVVIRPDSGDPVKIICGDPESNRPEVHKGLIECLWETFGGTTNDKGYRTLDSHIGAIYGDSITPDRQTEILLRLQAKGFASDNIVLGLGSYTYQYTTRDTYGFAMKATAGITKSKGLVEIFKQPATDDGTKNSHKGLLKVVEEDGRLVCKQGVSRQEEKEGLLRTVFLDGMLYDTTTLAQIRKRIKSYD